MTNLTSITGLSYLNTSKVTNMASMFNACSNLTSLDVSGFNTALATTMNYMFYKCQALTTLKVGSLSTAKAPTMKYMFASCTALTSIDISGITFNSSIDTEYLLKDCPGLKTLAIPSTANSLNANACTNVGTKSAPCTLDYPSGFTPTKDATGSGWYQWKAGYFKDATAEAAAYAWLSSDGKKLTFCHDTSKASRAGTTYSLNTGTNNPGWYDKRTSITSVVFNSAFASARPTTCYRWFYGMTNLTSITGLSYLNTSKVTNMASMFNACSSLTSIDAYTFSTENVTTMNYMFYKCTKLTSLNLSYISTAKAPTMKYMFASCSALASLNISGITFSSSLDTEYLLKDCSALRTLVIPSTANGLNSNACTNVGTKASPCTLVYPSGFTPQKDATGSGWFQWKSGYFKASTGSPGDANGQGEVTVSDVQLAMQYVLGKNPAGIVLANTEVTGDGEISINDVSAIAEMVLDRPAVIAARAHESMTDMLALTAKGSRCTVHLSATAPYHAFQMTVVLPEGARMGNVRLADGRANGHHAEWHEVAPGRYNIVCWSSNGEALREGPTALLHFDISGCNTDDVMLEAVQMVDDWCGTVLLPATSGIATGIAWVVDDASNDSDSPYYNTVGIGSKTPQRGVNIKDGKKRIKRD
jgi:surface protein